MARNQSQMKFKIDGFYAKLLVAYSKLLNLIHSANYQDGGLLVDVYVKTRWYESVLDVYKEGCIPHVSSMREYVPSAKEDDVEKVSKKIVEGTFGDGRYIKSFKGGDGYMVIRKKLEFVPRFEIHNLPKSLDELMLCLDLAGINWKTCKVDLQYL